MLGLVALAGPAVADTVYLIGGGSYKGKVRIEGDRVIVEIPGGSMTLDRSQVARIEAGEDLYGTLSDRRAKLAGNDADGHYELGVWAIENNLPGRDLFLAAVRIKPGHVAANLALGRVFLDNAWVEPELLAEQMRRWLDDGQNYAAMLVGRQALAGLLTGEQRRRLLNLTATAERRNGYFSQALLSTRELIALTPVNDPQYDRLTAIVEVLRAWPSGLYLVRFDPLLPAGDQDVTITRSGFYSLSADHVLEVALRDRAKQVIAEGQALMAQAKAIEVTDPAKAISAYSQAEEQFLRAEGLDPDIARSYRVEIRRRQIQIRQSAAEALALRFDGLNRQLEEVYKSRQAGRMRNHLKLMLSLLDDIQRQLDQVLSAAAGYPQELSLIIAWTHEDLATVKAMRQMLEGELDLINRGQMPSP